MNGESKCAAEIVSITELLNKSGVIMADACAVIKSIE